MDKLPAGPVRELGLSGLLVDGPLQRRRNANIDGRTWFCFSFARGLAMEAEYAGREFKAEELLRTLDDIASLLQQGAKALWGTDDFSKISEAGMSYEYERLKRVYAPYEAPPADRR